ncbi:GNAT family N-acetyltransferase [Dichotomicrobium thermohalophilum]|uniref:N-acetylglutamate synthase-like GNAT family acetyltransferase n=1 Tax=Dichotomicrobium thermohalophilum TaxID=933063 RepID=A0A397Q8N1_9HYPH|nr:GNAT family N-acetyltransferase [Dichotomicrobium thermohalophilum]RIA56879.1 N-acetylglutamate synthase-like GNAT family acetyltransferase [Dichotomicrobium thermohalophilum]
MPFKIRPATPRDEEAVAALLQSSYGTLLADAYDPDVLERALPLLTRPRPGLLASGRYHIAEFAGLGPAGCGGWSLEAPDQPDTPVELATGHLRHFATHPDAVRQGIGASLLERCVAEAKAAGVQRLQCVSTRQAVPFYAALGLRVVGPVPCQLAPDITLAGVSMVLDLRETS